MNYASRTCSKLTALSSRRLLFSHYPPPITKAISPSYTSIVSPSPSQQRRRLISTNHKLWKNETNEESPKQTNQRDQDAQEEEVKFDIGEAAKQQIRRPWMREGADEPPVSQDRKDMNKTMGKGRCLIETSFHFFPDQTHLPFPLSVADERTEKRREGMNYH